jgi:hypothetical protein
MSRLLTVVPLALATLALGACTWVKPDEGGARVRVAYDGNIAGCSKLGEIGVGVRDSFVPGVEREPLKVRDELESLARNEAATLQADTVVALGEPVDGEQRFAAYRCR